jgi:DNA primase
MGISEQKLLTLLQKVLGEGKLVSKNEAMFMCPFSHHRKPKLAVNLTTQYWQSWIDTNAKGRSIFALFKRLQVPSNYFAELSKIVKLPKSTQLSDTEEQYVSLPYEFKRLTETHTDFSYTKAMNYLKIRGIESYDIERYDIGYCATGDYAGRIIVPSYDEENKLNYFLARDFTGTAYLKYKNPPVSKDVVVFENQIDYTEPLVLCEGVFDAIAIRRNAVALLGKNIPSKLKIKMIKNKVSEVYVVLDEDAIKNAISITETLLNEDIKVRFVKMGNEDAADVGFRDMTEKLRNTPLMGFDNLMKQKLCMS